MVVDSDLTNYKDLVESVVERYPPGYLEVAHVQYYDEVLKSFPEITSDQQLMTMFSKHSHVHFKLMIDSMYLLSHHSQSLETTAKKKRKYVDCTPKTSKRYLSLVLKI